MVAGIERSQRRRTVRRRIASVVATAGALAVFQAGLAPVAVAGGVQDQQWYLDSMQIKKVWKVSKGKDVTVAVIDSGVNKSTASLRGQVLPGKDFSGAPGDETKDDSGHGTTMAELIAGTGKRGTLKGMAPESKVVPYRIGLEGVKGKKEGFGVSGTPQAIRAAADSDAKIINMSFAEIPNDELEDALDYAASKGKLLVSGTGNDAQKGNGQARDYPVSHTSVAAIAALGKGGKVSDFSSHGERAVTFAAPGEELVGWCDGRFREYCSDYKGTSASSAIAAGSAALVWAKHPTWTANQVIRVLIETAGRSDGVKNSVNDYIGNGAIRPRMNLLEGQGKPGDPNLHPLSNEKIGPSGKGARSPEDSGSEKADGASGKGKTADSVSGDGGDSGSLLPILGVGAGVVVLAGGGFAFVRMRRKSAP